MFENLTKQSLPSSEYRELLGTALCVFNGNNSFIIENILKNDYNMQYNWSYLIDKTSGNLKKPIADTIQSAFNDEEILELFEKIVSMRNRIEHSFRITNKKGEQSLATKEKNGIQYEITIDYLVDFIKLNDNLSTKLHRIRGY